MAQALHFVRIPGCEAQSLTQRALQALASQAQDRSHRCEAIETLGDPVEVDSISIGMSAEFAAALGTPRLASVMQSAGATGLPAQIDSGGAISCVRMPLEHGAVRLNLLHWPAASMDAGLAFARYGGAGLIVGRIAQRAGMLFDPRGLFWRSSQSPDAPEQPITNDALAALEFLGFDSEAWRDGFTTRLELFEWVARSRFFRAEHFALRAHLNEERARIERSMLYRQFSLWCTATEPAPGPDAGRFDMPAMTMLRLWLDEACARFEEFAARVAEPASGATSARRATREATRPPLATVGTRIAGESHRTSAAPIGATAGANLGPDPRPVMQPGEPADARPVSPMLDCSDCGPLPQDAPTPAIRLEPPMPVAQVSAERAQPIATMARANDAPADELLADTSRGRRIWPRAVRVAR